MIALVWQVRRENTFKAQPMSKSKESQKCKVCSGRGAHGEDTPWGGESRRLWAGGPGCPAETLDSGVWVWGNSIKPSSTTSQLSDRREIISSIWASFLTCKTVITPASALWQWGLNGIRHTGCSLQGWLTGRMQERLATISTLMIEAHRLSGSCSVFSSPNLEHFLPLLMGMAAGQLAAPRWT